MSSVIDLHAHLLPGMDDGPEMIEESVVLAREAAAAGTRVLVATPHVNRRYPNQAERIGRKVRELEARLKADGVQLELRAGAEVALSQAIETDPEELQRLTLGGGPWLLLEPPFLAPTGRVDVLVSEVRRRQPQIMLAHPERCQAFQRDPGMLRSLVEEGVLTSITAGSLVGRFGASVRRFALTLLHEGLVHDVASDAHDRYARPPGMASALTQAGVGALAEWLTTTVPAAVLEGGEIPARPEVVFPEMKPVRRGPWLRRRLSRAR